MYAFLQEVTARFEKRISTALRNYEKEIKEAHDDYYEAIVAAGDKSSAELKAAMGVSEVMSRVKSRKKSSTPVAPRASSESEDLDEHSEADKAHKAKKLEEQLKTLSEPTIPLYFPAEPDPDSNEILNAKRKKATDDFLRKLGVKLDPEE